MRSVNRRFKDITQKNQSLSSFICFTSAIKGQGFSRDRLRRAFYKLVDKDDYSKKDIKMIFNYLEDLNKSI